MDRQLRQLERLREEEPEAWLLGLQRAGKLGPTNMSVLGMLGYQPAVNIMGGTLRHNKQYTYWFRSWHLERSLEDRSWTGYNAKLHRIWFYSKRTVWMLRILGELSTNNRRDQEEWLRELDNRQQFLGVLLKEI